MTRGFLRFVRGNTIALLALFLALGGTTYAASTALIGKNTVASPQVVNGSLKTIDLSKRARAALKGNRGLRGFTGAQGPKGATGAQGVQGAKGDQGPSGPARTDNDIAGTQCDPISATHVTCQSVDLTLAAAGRVMLVWDSGWFSTSTASEGSCRLAVDGIPVTGEAEVGEPTINSNGDRMKYIGINFVTSSLAAGLHTFTSECKEDVANITFEDGTLSALYAGAA